MTERTKRGIRRSTAAGATIIQFPAGPCRLDVRDALLKNLSDPKAATPPELQGAIDARARELADEAYQLCRTHLRRRVAYWAEGGHPERVIDMNKARRALAEGGLSEALAHVYRVELYLLVQNARLAAEISRASSQGFTEFADKVSKAAGFDAV